MSVKVTHTHAKIIAANSVIGLYTFVGITRPKRNMAIIRDTLLLPIRFACHCGELISSYVRSMRYFLQSQMDEHLHRDG